MGEAGREQVIAGIAAAEGLAIGRIVLDRLEPRGTRQAGDPAAEQAALRAAIEKSIADLELLLARYPAGRMVIEGELPVIGEPVPAGLPSELLTRRSDVQEAWLNLLAADADPTPEDYYGRTALDLAVTYGPAAAVERILAAGADGAIDDAKRARLLEVARQRGDMEAPQVRRLLGEPEPVDATADGG